MDILYFIFVYYHQDNLQRCFRFSNWFSLEWLETPISMVISDKLHYFWPKKRTCWQLIECPFRFQNNIVLRQLETIFVSTVELLCYVADCVCFFQPMTISFAKTTIRFIGRIFQWRLLSIKYQKDWAIVIKTIDCFEWMFILIGNKHIYIIVHI